MKKHLLLPALLLLFVFSALLFLPAGSPAEAASPSGTVVTSFYPVWILTRNLLEGAGNITVRNLAAPSVGCLHDYQLQPADMKVLSGADALLVNGAGMEAFLPEITRSFPDLPVIEASTGIELLKEGDALQIGDAEEEEVNSDPEDDEEIEAEDPPPARARRAGGGPPPPPDLVGLYERQTLVMERMTAILEEGQG